MGFGYYLKITENMIRKGKLMPDIKIGIIGLDTSHVIAFTDIINNKETLTMYPAGKSRQLFREGHPVLISVSTGWKDIRMT